MRLIARWGVGMGRTGRLRRAWRLLPRSEHGGADGKRRRDLAEQVTVAKDERIVFG